jgi:hypothetical protein
LSDENEGNLLGECGPINHTEEDELKKHGEVKGEDPAGQAIDKPQVERKLT